jgi:hypothetical protein
LGEGIPQVVRHLAVLTVVDLLGAQQLQRQEEELQQH